MKFKRYRSHRLLPEEAGTPGLAAWPAPLTPTLAWTSCPLCSPLPLLQAISSRPALSGAGPSCGLAAEDPHLLELCALMLGTWMALQQSSGQPWLSEPLSRRWTHRECPANKDRSTGAGLPWAGPQAQRVGHPCRGWGEGGGLPRAGCPGSKGRALGKALLGPPPGPPPSPPPKGKERLINQLLWATKQNKSH